MDICITESLYCTPETNTIILSIIDEETVETVAEFILRASKSLQMVLAAMKLKDTYSLEGKL